jgi:hypothetical protein
MGAAELRNSERELQQFSCVGIAGVAMLVAFGSARPVFFPVVQHDRRSQRQPHLGRPVAPNRGLIRPQRRCGSAQLLSTLGFSRRVKSVEADRPALGADRDTPKDQRGSPRGDAQSREPADPHAALR